MISVTASSHYDVYYSQSADSNYPGPAPVTEDTGSGQNVKNKYK